MDDKLRHRQDLPYDNIADKQRQIFSKPYEFINQAADMMKLGEKGQENAAILLHRNIRKWQERRFILKGAKPEDAEEMVIDVILKFTSATCQKEMPVAYFKKIAKNVFIDFFRETSRQKGHFKAGEDTYYRENNVGEEEWEAAIDCLCSHFSDSIEGGIHFAQAVEAFEQDHPELSLALTLVAEGEKIPAIAAFFESTYEAAKSRISNARSIFKKFLSNFGRKS